MALPAPSVFPSSSSSSSASHPFGWFHPGTNRTDSRGLPLFLDGPRAGFVLDEVRSSVVQTRGSGCRGSSKHRRRARSWAGARQRVEASDQGERRQAKEAPSVAGACGCNCHHTSGFRMARTVVDGRSRSWTFESVELSQKQPLSGVQRDRREMALTSCVDTLDPGRAVRHAVGRDLEHGSWGS